MQVLFILDHSNSNQLLLQSCFPSNIYPQAILHSLSHSLHLDHHPNNLPQPILHLPSLDPPSSKPSLLHTPATSPPSNSSPEFNFPQDALSKSPQHSGSILCHVLRDNLRFAAVLTLDLEPSAVFVFLDQLIRLLRFYLHTPTLSPALIRSNFSLVLQLLNLTVPPPGAPLALSSADQPDLIAAILPRPSPGLTTFFSQAADSLKLTASSIASRPTSVPSPVPRSAPSLFASSLPWRPANLYYSHEQVYLDICESLFATLDRTGSIIASSFGGRIDMQSKLSGMPELALSFANPTQVFNGIGFHPCVRHGRWLRERTISFVPPDRPFVLMSYRARANLRLPLTSRVVSVTVGDAGGTFKIQLTAASAPVAKICLRWSLGHDATGLLSDSLVARLNSGPHESKSSTSLSERWEWEDHCKSLVWYLDHLPSGQSASLEGIWTHSSSTNRPGPAILVTFEVPHGSSSTSGLIVDKLIVFQGHGEVHRQVQKGVRSQLENGRIEIRWS